MGGTKITHGFLNDISKFIVITPNQSENNPIWKLGIKNSKALDYFFKVTSEKSRSALIHIKSLCSKFSLTFVKVSCNIEAIFSHTAAFIYSSERGLQR